jgi:hypothetical protein
MLPDIFLGSPLFTLWYGRSNRGIIFDLRKQSALDKLFEKTEKYRNNTYSRTMKISTDGQTEQTEQKTKFLPSPYLLSVHDGSWCTNT